MRIWISGPRLFGELIRPGISVSDRELRAFLVRRGKLVKEIAMATGFIAGGVALLAWIGI